MMKACHFLLGACCVTLISMNARATTPSNHYSVSISAKIRATVSTGPDSAESQTTKIDNSTILGTLVRSGSFPESAAQMDIVYSGTPELSVIDRSTHAILYTIAVSGTESIYNKELDWGSTATKVNSQIIHSLDITFPVDPLNDSFPNTFETYSSLRATTDHDFTDILDLMISFTGTDGTNIIEGTVRKGDRVYNY